MECSNCPFKHTKVNEVPARERKFTHNGMVLSAKMKAYSDAFYEITEGKFKGNLVHIFDVIDKS
jgi:hypothetical protein